MPAIVLKVRGRDVFVSSLDPLAITEVVDAYKAALQTVPPDRVELRAPDGRLLGAMTLERRSFSYTCERWKSQRAAKEVNSKSL